MARKNGNVTCKSCGMRSRRSLKNLDKTSTYYPEHRGYLKCKGLCSKCGKDTVFFNCYMNR